MAIVYHSGRAIDNQPANKWMLPLILGCYGQFGFGCREPFPLKGGKRFFLRGLLGNRLSMASLQMTKFQEQPGARHNRRTQISDRKGYPDTV